MASYRSTLRIDRAGSKTNGSSLISLAAGQSSLALWKMSGILSKKFLASLIISLSLPKWTLRPSCCYLQYWLDLLSQWRACLLVSADPFRVWYEHLVDRLIYPLAWSVSVNCGIVFMRGSWYCVDGSCVREHWPGNFMECRRILFVGWW